MRKAWHQHWMETAQHAAEMSTCASGRKVGAVFVKDQRVVSTGFNGVPVNFPHPLVCVRREENIPSGQDLHKCACAHAEANGIANAARAGTSLLGSVLFCTTQPCAMCMGALANVGVKEVIYAEQYPHEMTERIRAAADIPMTQYVLLNGKGILRVDPLISEDFNDGEC